MTSHPPTTDYEPPTAPRRSIGTWIALLLVWTVGLISWTLYGAAAIYLLQKVL